YSSASSFVVRGDVLIFKTYIEEQVSHAFLSQVKASMLASLSALIPNLPTNIDERLAGIPLDEANAQPLASFFHIPLIVGNNVVGLINVSSTKPNLYKEDEMTILYQITGQASNALSNLKEVLDTEKGKLTAMISGLADGVFMIDRENNLSIINQAAKNLLGIQKDTPTFFDVMGAMYPTYDLPSRVNLSLSQSSTHEEKEVRVGNKVLQVFITPVLTREGSKQKAIGASVLLHDVTTEKNIAQIKEDFTNMMVHELRAPLTAIKDSSELILTDQDRLQKEEREKFLKIINKQSGVLLDQIGQVLDAAKIEAGRFTIQRSQQDLKKIIDERIETFKLQAQKQNISLIENVKELPNISVDPLRISQVLNNLLSNSLKFTPSGGTVTISAKLETGLIQIFVTDTGIGIPGDLQEDIFSKFFQVASPTPGLKKGTGLGLYLVKGIVEAHGGKVFVESKEGQGTTISFTLPAVQSQVQTAQPLYAEHLVN
ncbi:MAG: ATP-binding protein, partial [Candidatus Levyibacteriota bacterium]